jgi:hypothetical protein
MGDKGTGGQGEEERGREGDLSLPLSVTAFIICLLF